MDGIVMPNCHLRFDNGKKCNFKMHSEDLRNSLMSKPFFAMFVDATSQNVIMHASANISIGVYGQNYEFFEDEKLNWNLRRNYISLFDNMKNEVMRLDVSIGISLCNRDETTRLQSQLDSIHPLIPGAKMTGN